MRTSLKAVAAAAALLVGLTGCEKPKPEVTVFSGPDSVRTAALCWSADAAAGCDTSTIAGTEDSLTVHPGATLGISVDSEVAEAGWVPQLVIGGQPQQLSSAPIHRRYWKMQFPETAGSSLMGQMLTLQVVSLTADATSARGVWSLLLKPVERADNA